MTSTCARTSGWVFDCRSEGGGWWVSRRSGQLCRQGEGWVVVVASQRIGLFRCRKHQNTKENITRIKCAFSHNFIPGQWRIPLLTNLGDRLWLFDRLLYLELSQYIFWYLFFPSVSGTKSHSCEQATAHFLFCNAGAPILSERRVRRKERAYASRSVAYHYLSWNVSYKSHNSGILQLLTG